MSSRPMSMKPVSFPGLATMLTIGAPVLGQDKKIKQHRSHKVQNKNKIKKKTKPLRYGYDLYRREIFAKHVKINDFKTKNAIASSGWKKLSPSEKEAYTIKVKKLRELEALQESHQEKKSVQNHLEERKKDFGHKDKKAQRRATEYDDLDQELLDLFTLENDDLDQELLDQLTSEMNQGGDFLDDHDSDFDLDENSRLD